MTEKEHVVNEILELELQSFLRVPTKEEPSCRAHTDDLKIHRRSQFAPWSIDTCRSYLSDLRHARESGVNLMTQKYARMDDLIPCLSTSPLIDRIVKQYSLWQEAIQREFPNVMKGARDAEDFRTYLRGELETYSDRTLQLLWADIQRHIARRTNMTKEVYEELARQNHYPSLASMEKTLT